MVVVDQQLPFDYRPFPVYILPMATLYEAARKAGVQFDADLAPTQRMFDTGELELSYLDWGPENAPTVILLHGFAQNAHSWDYTALALGQKYRVISLDARGHGDSDWAADADYATAAHQRDLGRFIEQFRGVPVTLVGLSMGGRTSYVYASRQPANVLGLVIVDSGPTWPKAPRAGQSGGRRIMDFVTLPDELDTWEEFVERIHQYNPRRSVQEVRDTLIHKVRQAPNGKWTWKYDRVLRRPDRPRETVSADEQWRRLEDISCPTLVVRGAESDILASETATEMATRMQNCKVVEVEGAGHLVPGDNPVRFIAVVSDWLDELHSAT